MYSTTYFGQQSLFLAYQPLTYSKRVDGKFLGSGGSAVPESQAICISLIEECFEISQEIKARSGEEEIAGSLKPIYDRLWETRTQLESLLMTHRWTLRETDLYNYSQSLKEIDKLRVDGKFVDQEGDKPSGQYVSPRAYSSIQAAYKIHLSPIVGSAVPSEKVLRYHLQTPL